MYKYLLVLLVIASCTVTKKVDTTEVKKAESKTLNLDSLAKVISDSVSKKEFEKRKDLESQIEFYQENVTVSNDVIAELQMAVMDSTITLDSLRSLVLKLKETKCPDNKIIIRPDGSIEASGAIKKLNYKISELERQKDSIARHNEELNKVVKSTTENKTDESKVKKVNKKTKFLNWLIFLVAGYVICVFFPPSKITKFVKSLIKK